METKADFVFLILFKITADNNCSREIKRQLFLGSKAITNLDSILKSRHHFVDKSVYSQSYGFSSMYACESWTIKKAEHQRIDIFELWGWEKTPEEFLGLQGDQTT